MKKSIIIPVFLVAALLGSAAYSINGRIENNNAYETAMLQAKEYAQNGIVVDAVEQYKVAISYNPTLEAYLGVGRVYLDNGDLTNARKWYKNKLKTSFPREPAVYLFGIEVFLARNNYRSAFEVYDDYRSRQLYSEEVEAAIDTIRYRYDLVGTFDEVGVFSNASLTSAVKHDNLWGYVDTSMNRKLPYIYREAGYFSTYAAVIDEEGNAYYIDQSGNVKINETLILSEDPEFNHVERFQPIQSNLALAYNGEIWNYYDISTMEKKFGGYREATPIANGVGAVSEDGKSWALISQNGTLITDFIYDGVLMDSKNIVCRGSAIIAKLNGKYVLLNKNGTQINGTAYDAAVAFNDNTYAAVRKGTQWFFIDDAGNEVLSVPCEDARSFSFGLAAIKRDGKWGYIDKNEELVIPCEFVEAEAFSSQGVAFVKVTDSIWRLLKLYQYNHG